MVYANFLGHVSAVMHDVHCLTERLITTSAPDYEAPLPLSLPTTEFHLLLLVFPLRKRTKFSSPDLPLHPTKPIWIFTGTPFNLPEFNV
jgi:hypothetical protein